MKRKKPTYHFPDIRKTIPWAKGAEKDIDDILLTRYYLIAQNGDIRKEEIAFAQNYFAVQTLSAELVEQRILEFGRVKAHRDSFHSGLLSLTFHRAFDRGLIAISDDYRVLVHPHLKDYNPQSGIRQYENKELHLPGEERFYPSVKSLREHRGWSV